MTQIVPLNFSNLAELDEGRMNKMLEFHLAKIAHDCLNRPSDTTKRKVCLEFTVTPIFDPNTQECGGSKVEIECKSRVPVHKSRPYEMRVTSKGFLFNRDVPTEFDQPSLYPEGDEG